MSVKAKKITTSFSCDQAMLEWIEQRARDNQISKSEQIHNMLGLAQKLIKQQEKQTNG